MVARVSRFEGQSADRTEQGIEMFREQVLPAARQMDGFEGALLLVDPSTSAAMSITLWESEEAMSASEEAANRLRSEAGERIGSQATVERYEIAVSEIAALTIR
jgi:heme-degrading monooxygenase HmoA